jgi:hypothetical protein
MKMKEESTFLQGVESRLDSLFAEDDQPQKAKDSDPVHTEIPEAPASVETDVTEGSDSVEKTAGQTEELQQEEGAPAQDKSEFMTEIEKRFASIFGPDEKEAGAAVELDEQKDLKKIIDEAAPEGGDSDEQTEGFTSPPSAVYSSPLKDMKSIILSIEWEINDDILAQLEEEISKLYLLYTGDRAIQGFLRILRFLGRYVKVRGVRTSQDSINLLLSIYDQLENVMITDGMTESRKQAILVDSIRKYRAWVQSADLTGERRAVAGEAATEDVPVLTQEMEPWADRPAVDEKEEIQILVEGRDVEQPAVEPVAEDLLKEEPIMTTAAQEDDIAEEALEASTPAAFVVEEPVAADEIQMPSPEQKIESRVEAMKELPPHEAFVYAVEEIKKDFQAEIDALKEEIRLLKSAR